MKKSILLLSFLVISLDFQIFAQTTQTEEYAIVDVYELKKKNIIRITIGEEPSTEKEWQTEKTEIAGDLSPVVKELNALNKKGYKLLNMATTYRPAGGGGPVKSYNRPRYTFMMVRKLE